MATKTERVVTKIDTAARTTMFVHEVRKGEDWVVAGASTYCLDEVPAEIQLHLALYGIKGFLGDRCSQFRSHGANAYLDATLDLWKLLEQGMLSAPRKSAGGIDRALVHLVAELKGQSLPWAEAQLKALPKETREALAEKYADRLKEIRAELTTSTAGADDELADLL